VHESHALRHPYVVIATAVSAASEMTLQAYMVGPSGVLRKALFSRGVAARLVAVRGLLYMIIQQLRTMDEGEAEDAMEADPELSCSQVHSSFCISAFQIWFHVLQIITLDMALRGTLQHSGG